MQLLHIHFCPDCAKSWECKEKGHIGIKNLTCFNCRYIAANQIDDELKVTQSTLKGQQLQNEIDLQIEKFQERAALKEKSAIDRNIEKYNTTEDDIRAHGLGITLNEESRILKITGSLSKIERMVIS